MRKVIWSLWLLLTIAMLTKTVNGHVSEGTGAALQLFSYYTENPPKINGSLTDATNDESLVSDVVVDADEWKDAAVRELLIISDDGFDTINAVMFTMNDADSLYVGLTTNFGNSSNGTYLQLLIDQGDGGGSHNDQLDGGAVGADNGDYGARVYTKDSQLEEFSFNGTGWQQQSAGSEAFKAYAKNLGTSFIQAEFSIPITNNPSTNDSVSYLDLDSTDEIGMFISFYVQGGNSYYTWIKTNSDTIDATSGNGWMDVRLGVSEKFNTFYATYNANGNPTIDGNISGGATADDAWRGAYRRNVTLSNYDGSTIDAVLYGCEDQTGSNFYVGLKVLDDENDIGDYCQIYQEDDGLLGNNKGNGRNYLLESGSENALRANENAFALTGDLYWNAGTPAWAGDASNAAQDAIGKWYDDGYYEYEYLVHYDWDGDDQDLNVNGGVKVGFTLRYHDANDNSDYFWEFSPNTDAVGLDENGSTFSSAGWVNMQLGAPYVQVIFPEDDKQVEGVVNVRVYAVDEDGADAGSEPDPVVSAIFYRKSVPGTTYDLTRIDSEHEWSGTWNVSNLPNGPDTLVVEVTDDDGITVERLVPVTINNDGGTVIMPSVSVTSPAVTDVISGTDTLKFITDAGSGSVITDLILLIDGDSVALDSAATSYVWQTNSLKDGAHTVQFIVTNDETKTSLSQVYAYQVNNSPVVTINSPSADSVLNSSVTVSFTATAVSPATIVKKEFYVDGALVDTTETDSTTTWNTLINNDGQHFVQIKVTDSDGKVGVSSLIGVTVQNAPTVSIISPSAGEALNGIHLVTFTVTPISSATIMKREVSVDGGPWTDSLVDTSFYFMNTSGWEDGSHTIQVRGTDNKGRIGYSNTRLFVVDNEAPLVSDPKVTYIDDATTAKNGSPVLFTVLAKDIAAGLVGDSSAVILSSDWIVSGSTVTLNMYDDGTHGDKVANDNIFSVIDTITIDTTGEFPFTITAEDELGNSKSITGKMILDNTAPVISNVQLIPNPELATIKRTYFDKLIIKGKYSDAGGSGLGRVFITVVNDSGDNVNNSPIELSVKDSLFSRILNLVPGNNLITVTAIDRAGNSISDRDTVNYIEPKVTKIISETGGTVASPNGVSVVIPANALYGSEEITVTKVDPIDQPEPVASEVKLLNVAHEFGPDGTTFKKDVTVTLTYTEANLDPDQDGERDFDPANFALVFWDGETWQSTGKATVDTVAMTVSVKVNHFTMYDIAQVTGEDITELKAAWTHNPVSAEGGSHFKFKVPENGTADLYIIDLAGDLVTRILKSKPVIADQVYTAEWRGANVSGIFAGAGLYVYVFKYTDSDGEETLIRKPVALVK